MVKDLIIVSLPSDRLPANAETQLKEASPNSQIRLCPDKDAILPYMDELTIAAGEFPPSLLERCPRLRWFHSWYAGTDWIRKFPKLIEKPFTLTNSVGIHGDQMAEHLFGLLIARYRHFPEAFAAQSRRDWLKWRYDDMDTLSGKTLLILGYGTIGKRVADIALAFGMSLIGVSRSGQAAPDSDKRLELYSAEATRSVLGRGDVVLNILPLTEETNLSADDAFFASMKKTAVYASIGRGGTTDEKALIKALNANIIAGAVLDVCAEEPLPPDAPLWKAKNLIITSHYAGFHPAYDKIAFRLFLENISRDRSGQPLRNIVDKNLGY